MAMEFDYNYYKGFSTSIPDRAIGVTTTSNRGTAGGGATWFYLNSDTGNDANGGGSDIDAVKTISVAVTKAAAHGTRKYVYITNSDTYDAAGDLQFLAASFPSGGGIVSKAGEAPIINLGDYQIIITMTGSTIYLTNLFIDTSTNLIADATTDNMININGTYAGNSAYIENCHLRTRWQSNESRSTKRTIYTSSATRMYLKNSIVQNYSSCQPVIQGANSNSQMTRNIIINNSEPLDKDKFISYDTSFNYLNGSLGCNLSNLIATKASGTATMLENRYVGYVLKIVGASTTQYYKIIKNTSTQFYLENTWGVGNYTETNRTTTIHNLYEECCVGFQQPTSGSTSQSMQNNIFIGNNTRSGMLVRSQTNGNTLTINEQDSLYLNCQTGIVITDQDVNNDTSRVNLNTSHSIMYSPLKYSIQEPSGLTTTQDTNIVITDDDYDSTSGITIDNNLIPLFVDKYKGLINGRIELELNVDGYDKASSYFRLREYGKRYLSTDDFFMQISSPLLNIGVSGGDLGAWNENVSVSSTGYANSYIITYPPTSLTVSETPKNPFETNDINGNLRQSIDNIKRDFTFTWEQGSNISNEQLAFLKELCLDPYPKKWYPLGDGNSLLTSDSNGTVAQDSDNNYYITAVGTIWPKHWIGFWITINSKDYYIYDNDNSKIYFVDKLGGGYPTLGAWDFSIEYMLVHIRLSTPVSYSQPLFSRFLQGGSWDDQTADDAQYSYTGATTMILSEVENPEDK